VLHSLQSFKEVHRVTNTQHLGKISAWPERTLAKSAHSGDEVAVPAVGQC